LLSIISFTLGLEIPSIQMKYIGIALIVLGICMFIFNFFPYSIEEVTYSGKNVEIAAAHNRYNFIYPRVIGIAVAIIGLIVFNVGYRRSRF